MLDKTCQRAFLKNIAHTSKLSNWRMSTMPVNYQTSKFLLPIFLPIPAKKNWIENEIERNLKQNFYDFIRILDYCNLVVEGKWTFPTKKLWKLKEALSFTNFLYNIEIHNLVLSYIKHIFFTHLYSYLKYRGSLLNLYFGTKIFAKWVKLVRTLGLYWNLSWSKKSP